MRDNNDYCVDFLELTDEEQKRRDWVRRAHMSLAYEHPIKKELDESRPVGTESRWCHIAIREDGSRELVQIDPSATRCLDKARGLGAREEIQEEVPCTRIKLRRVRKEEDTKRALLMFQRLLKEGRKPYIEGPIRGSSSFTMLGQPTSRAFGVWLIEYDCYLEEFPGESRIELLDEPTLRFVLDPENRLIDCIVPHRDEYIKYSRPEQPKIFQHESVIYVYDGKEVINMKLGDTLSENVIEIINSVLPRAKENLLNAVRDWYEKSVPFKGNVKVLEA